MLEKDLPTSHIKAEPHIESRIRLLKRQYSAISDMLNLGSGFGWNDVKKCVIAAKDVYDDWVRSHPSAKGLRNRPFPFYDDFLTIFEKDRATGQGTETAADVVEDQNKEDSEDDNVGGLFESKTDDVSVHFVPEARKATQSTGKKKVKTSEGNNPRVNHVVRFHDAYEKTAEQFKGIASFFIKEMEATDRRHALFDELKKLEGFSREELLIVGEFMVRNAYKIDYFFSLPTDFKHEYIGMVLAECNVYHPTFQGFLPPSD
ncbi:hypothetical protein PTKIN_Ptkin09bG0284300 [Pterospermum kingtungense]